jgi:hypothetical protein
LLIGALARVLQSKRLRSCLRAWQIHGNWQLISKHGASTDKSAQAPSLAIDSYIWLVLP